jgi:phage/plasmid-like protein (TIGR03299 family)
MLAKLPESIEPVPGDKVDGYFLVTTGHNGYTSYEAMLTPIRVVCQNTLTIARNTAKTTVRLRHTKSELEQVEMVAVMVNELATGLKQSGEIFKKLAKKKWNAADVRAYVNAVLKTTEETEGVKAQQRDDVIELAYHGAGTDISKGTAWAAYNAVTEYVDHVRTQKNVRMLKARDASSIFGLQAQLKARALEMALDAVK